MSLERIVQKSVVTLPRSATIQEAAKLMREMHVGDVVVLETNTHRRKPVGILTDRDIVVSSVALGINPTVLLVEDIMSLAPIMAYLQDTAAHVIHLMREHGCRRIPILNQEGDLVGIVAADDLLGLLTSELTAVATLPRRQLEVETERKRPFN